MSAQILSSIRTKEERDNLLYEVELLRNSLFSTDPSAFEEALKNSVRSSSKMFVEDALRSNKDKLFFIEKLVEDLKKIPLIRATLAIDPTDGMISNIHDWLLKTFKHPVVMEYLIDKSIIGGAIIAYKGKHVDGSVRAKIAASS